MDSKDSTPLRRSASKDEPHSSLNPVHRLPQQHQYHTKEPSPKKDSPPEHNQTGLLSHASTHGHNLTEIEPMSKHSGASVTTFFNGLFQTILAISTLGASITFNYVLSNSQPTSATPIPLPNSRKFSPEMVQLFLAISWLLFLLALAFAALGSTLLTFFRRHWEEDWDGKRGKTSQTTVQMYAVFASTVLGGLVVGAFVLLCLVVVAYSSVVGWIALGFTSFFGFVMLVSIFNQVPWPWRDNTPTVKVPKRISV